MNTSTLEALIGAGVLALAGLVLGTAYSAHNDASPGYDLIARFNRTDGIGPGSPVLVSGVNVGSVTAQSLDNQYRAVLTLHIEPGIAVPTESTAAIQTDGVLGGKFLAILPGAGDGDMKPGEEFDNTQDSVSLTDILTLILDQAKSNKAASPPPAGQ